MAQAVSTILSHQRELAEKAFNHTHDLNEAGLMVGRVMSHAFERFQGQAPREAIAEAMTRDLDAMIAQYRN